MKKSNLLSWFLILLGVLYFFVPLIGTLDFSLRAVKDQLSLVAYQEVLASPRFASTFSFSLTMAVWTIVVSILLVVPTAYWVHLKLPQLRPVVEFITLLTFVVPAIVLVFGFIRIYSRPPLSLMETDLGTNALLIAGYVALSLPYMYRAVDTGLRSIDIRTLTEAAESLGAGWATVLFRVILPNLRVAILSGAFLTFAIVIGEFTLATFLARPAFGPYLANLGQTRPYQSTALTIMSLALTWGSIGIIQFIGRGVPGQTQVGGTH
ncbi:MAG: ABC transporter permease subunit [Chloroflexi bacterium]|nr:ABC transporter permease subunit [Chloroflexota bacterium]